MRIGVMHDLAVGVHPTRRRHLGDAGRPRPGRRRRRAAGHVQPAGAELVPAAVAARRARAARATRRSATCCARSCGTRAPSGSTTSSGCSGCGGSRTARAPADGAYVTLRPRGAHRHPVPRGRAGGAVVIGEDLGNVEPWVRDYLTERGVLGTSVLWFEQRDGRPVPPEEYRRLALATVTTHDLPPTAGYLADEHVAIRERLGLLTDPVAMVRREAEAERERFLDLLDARGLLERRPVRARDRRGAAPAGHADAVRPGRGRARRRGGGAPRAEPARARTRSTRTGRCRWRTAPGASSRSTSCSRTRGCGPWWRPSVAPDGQPRARSRSWAARARRTPSRFSATMRRRPGRRSPRPSSHASVRASRSTSGVRRELGRVQALRDVLRHVVAARGPHPLEAVEVGVDVRHQQARSCTQVNPPMLVSSSAFGSVSSSTIRGPGGRLGLRRRDRGPRGGRGALAGRGGVGRQRGVDLGRARPARRRRSAVSSSQRRSVSIGEARAAPPRRRAGARRRRSARAWSRGRRTP